MKTPAKLLLFFFLCILLNACDFSTPRPPGERAPVPIIDKLADAAMLYYKIDDNLQFQTLQFQICDSISYTNIGRFNGKKLAKGKFQIDSLEVKFYQLRGHHSFKNSKIKITKVSLLEESSDDHIYIHLEVSDGDPIVDKVDYVYGRLQHDNEQPIVLNRDAKIDFYLSDKTTNGLLSKANCTDISPGSPIFPGGGYECNGIAITSD